MWTSHEEWSTCFIRLERCADAVSRKPPPMEAYTEILELDACFKD
ncbi:hypothetical protein EC2850400_1795 [Escherichia coli 2850400]|nr:hypothetical protein EC2850400_1795 [Escherichia coli 2850400]